MLSDTDTLSFAKNNLLSTFREVERDGKTWLVVNGVPLKETILNGRFMPFDEFASSPVDWNDVPVVLRHPKLNGGSARVPSSDVPVVGRFYNAKIEQDSKRLVGEFWLDKDVIANIQEGMALLRMIENQRPIEVSTGYWSETVPQEGKWNDKNYQYVDQNIHPDHIALLPDEVGACSIKDGCGLNRNNSEVSQEFDPSQDFVVVNGELWQNVTGSLPAEGKKIYEAVYQEYKDKKLSDAEAAQRAWDAVEKVYKKDENGKWVKIKQNIECCENLALGLFAAYAISELGDS